MAADGAPVSKKYDLIALGEAMLALAPPSGDTLRTCRSVHVDHAGAESNTCVGLARLGFSVAWVSRLGRDAAGDRILDALSLEGVDTRWVVRDPQRPTGVMLKDRAAGVQYYRTGSAASALSPDDLRLVPIADARAVLASGVTALIGPGAHAAGLALLSSARGFRIVDPNLRRGLWGSERRAELVSAYIDHCDILLGGADEIAELVGGGSAETLARRCAARGPREVVVRAAEHVQALTADGESIAVDIRRDSAVDPVGAGDAFNAGYIAVRLRGGSVADAVRAGVRCGASVTASMSDTSGFPRTLA
jgi:2-dehydro-3-deoxygluconokinase